VTDSAGNARIATRRLSIRDVGGDRTLVCPAIADTYVDAAATLAGLNFGAQNRMFYLSSSAAERGYLRFDLSGIAPGDIVTATLRLWAPPAYAINTVMNARACTNAWSETAMTWNDAPAPGAVVGSKTLPYLPPYGFFIDIPITAYAQTVGTDRLLSIALENADATQHLLIGTREGGMAAQVVMRVRDGGVAPVAPTITIPPAGRTVTAGQTATFGVTASGTAPLTYQWKRNGTAIAGATGASYTTPATTIADSGAVFTVTVANGAGSVTSVGAVLTVNPAPTPPVTGSVTDAGGGSHGKKCGIGGAAGLLAVIALSLGRARCVRRRRSG
jgi:hypothetical protein